MGEAGLFDEDTRAELIEGEVVQMAPIGARHFACVIWLVRLLQAAVGDRAIVSGHNPVVLDDHSEPGPDVALLRLRDDEYAKGLPGPGDVLLLIEVADTTLAWDRDRKAPLYARSAIPETWVVDLNGQEVIVSRRPSPGGYQQISRARRGETLRVEGLPSMTVTVDDVLGPGQ